jgi:hypothetical protein
VRTNPKSLARTVMLNSRPQVIKASEGGFSVSGDAELQAKFGDDQPESGKSDVEWRAEAFTTQHRTHRCCASEGSRAYDRQDLLPRGPFRKAWDWAQDSERRIDVGPWTISWMNDCLTLGWPKDVLSKAARFLGILDSVGYKIQSIVCSRLRSHYIVP